jgi:hypothetical protein
MRLGCCLVASDLNPLYLDFFPLLDRVWRKLLEIPLKLVLVADRIPPSLRDCHDDVILFPPIDGVKTAFQAQCLRLLVPALLSSQFGERAVLISDMDMLPMSRPYYTSLIADIPDDSFVVFRSDLLKDLRQIPMCYNAATSQTWSQLLGGIASIEAIRERLSEWAKVHHDYDGRPGRAGWDADQRILFDLIARGKQVLGASRVVSLDDRHSGFCRLDRSELMRSGELSATQAHQVSEHRFTDYHVLRPQARYRSVNDDIADMLLGERPPHAIRWRSPILTVGLKVLWRLRSLRA